MPRNKEVSQQMRAESRSALLDAGRKLFAERGFAACKVADIAQKAGMSQGNVYWYFSSKEKLLTAILADGFESLAEIMREADGQAGSALEKLEILFQRYLEFGRAGSEFVTILMTLLAQGGMKRLLELGFDTVQIGMGYHQSVGTILAQGQREGVVTEQIDPNQLSMFFFAFFNGLMFTYGNEWLDLSQEHLRGAVFRLLGIETR
ncbi:MAG TPA: TetR/AcrR family transcriptional regulator [Anaerolineales bacterium]|nr:TetR/AcrR family transcriptional regulator [Anaerolineales bacterium]